MAETKRVGSKKKTTTKSNSRKKSTSSKKPEKYVPTEKDIMVRGEVKLLFIFAAAVLLFISNFGLCGKVGGYLSYFIFGFFGIYAYIVPILVVVGGAFLISNRGNRKAVIKVCAGVFMLILLCALIQLITVKNGTDMKLGEIYKQCAVNRYGGGAVGGAVIAGLSSLIGVIGSYVVILVLIIATFIIITERSVIGGMKQKSSEAYQSAREDIARKRDNNDYAKQEKQRKRSARIYQRAQGVDLENTRIKGDEVLEDPDVHEIQPELEDSIFRGNINIHTESAPRTSLDEDEDDGEPFTPKEKIQVSKSALDTMSRKAFQTNNSEIKVHTEGGSGDAREIPVPSIDNTVAPSTEAKIATRNTGKAYVLPSLNLLSKGTSKKSGGSTAELKATALKLQQTLQNFGVGVTITDVSRGPSVTRYELQPEQGTKVSKITSLTDDIKLNLAAADIRIEAPIPGKAAVGIEVPNIGRDTVYFRELMESDELRNHPSKLAFAAGKDIGGKVIVADIAKMPHMLIAGTTGSGKSVFTNSIIMSILYRAKPSEVKLIIVDPKVVEFGVYNGIPHLLIPVVTDPKKAAGALNWAVAEMSDRYNKFAELNVRDLKGYNKKIKNTPLNEDGERLEQLPQIIIIIDELADLMMAAAKEVEAAICRLAQLARAAGIHLIIATQRPSVDVVTGLIKANIPSRVALLVSSGIDSRTIIDMNGAEKLLGNGDMLFYPSGYVKPVRLQGAFISDGEVTKVVSFIAQNSGEVNYDEEIAKQITKPISESNNGKNDEEDGRDAYFIEAAKFVIEREKASTSMLQRMFKVGFNRAARIMDQLEVAQIIGAEEGTKPRKVLMSIDELEAYLNTNNL